MAVLSTLLGGIFGLFCALLAWLAGGTLTGIVLVYATAAFGLFSLLMVSAILSGSTGDEERETMVAADLLALGEEVQARMPCAGKHPV